MIISDVSTSIKGLSPVSECQFEGMQEIWVPFCDSTYNEISESAWLVRSLSLSDKALVNQGLQFRNRKELTFFQTGKEDPKMTTDLSGNLEIYVFIDEITFVVKDLLVNYQNQSFHFKWM